MATMSGTTELVSSIQNAIKENRFPPPLLSRFKQVDTPHPLFLCTAVIDQFSPREFKKALGGVDFTITAAISLPLSHSHVDVPELLK